MPLLSELLKNDTRLEDCLNKPLAHIKFKTPPEVGPHVEKIHQALATLNPDGPEIPDSERLTSTYGRKTADAVKAYKSRPGKQVINAAYQHAPDDIVGQMTIKRMDDELRGVDLSDADIVDRAFRASRDSVRGTQTRLRQLQTETAAAMAKADLQRLAALVQLRVKFQRDIAVIARRLLVPEDPTSPVFQDALEKAIRLIVLNAGQPKTILAARDRGLCDLKNARNQPDQPFAWTAAGQPDPKTHLCTPFFDSAEDLQRDVITHEYFHLVGLADVSVPNTTEALRNANTLAQVVALITDRTRQVNSDGNEPAIPPLPTP